MKLTSLGNRVATLDTRRVGLLEGNPDSTPRLRGRAGVDRRARYLRLHPLCVLCKAEGRVTAGDVIDHRIPLWAGGEDDYGTNAQPLCFAHHEPKTACEAAMRAAGGWMATPCSCGQHSQPGGD